MNKLILITIITFMLTKRATAQVSIGYYPFQSEVSLSTHSERIIWGDLRLATNTFFGNVTTEPIVMVNIKKKEMITLYGGAGMNINFFNLASNISIINGYSFHFGSRIKPLKTIKNLQLIAEISPYLNTYFDGGLLRTRLGAAYQFHKKKS